MWYNVAAASNGSLTHNKGGLKTHYAESEGMAPKRDGGGSSDCCRDFRGVPPDGRRNERAGLLDL